MMKNLMKLLTISTLFALQGCSLTSTNSLYTKPIKELVTQGNSMLARGYVERVIPDETVAEMLSYYDGKEDEFNEAFSGFYTRDDIRNSNAVFVLTERSFGKLRGVILYIDKSQNLQEGDIIDYYNGQLALEALISREPTIISPLYSWLGSSYSVIIPNEPNGIQIVTPEAILGIVCRADDEGCDLNSTPATTIGYIRKLDSPADYRGIAIESLEPVLEPSSITLGEALVINACPTCDDEKDIKELKELGVIE